MGCLSHIRRSNGREVGTKTATELTGEIAERYALEGELGRGGTAVVYRARDRVGGTSVAIKILREDTLGSMSIDRFLTEIRRTSQLSHAHIVPVLASGEHSGRPFFVLPFMDGGTFRDRLNRAKQLPFEEVIALGVTVARALHFAHAHGVIHRDVKPENILFNNGQPCLADFGTARALEHAANDPTTSTGIVRGTAAYMSPEQASGEREYDGRTDIYSLGCVLYEGVAGMQPFIGPSVQAVITQRMSHTPRPVSVYRPSTPPELEAVLAKATAIAPADRYQTAGEFADALESVLPVVRNVKAAAEARAAQARVRRVQRIAIVSSLAVAAVAATWYALRPPLRANDWLLVADFGGPQDDPSLGAAVRDLATEGFRQSKFVQIVDRRQVNEMMRRSNVPETSAVTATRARELAVRSAINAVLEGNVRSLDDSRIEVVMHVVRPEDGATIASAVRTASTAELPITVQSIVDELRSSVGEHPDAIAATQPLRLVSTPSFAAFRKFSDAMDRLSRNTDIAGSSTLLREALQLDSAFAFAWMALATNHSWARQTDSARAAMKRALAFPDRLTPAQLYRLKGDIAFTFDHDVRGALQWYDRVVAEAPSAAALSTRGLYRAALGQYREALPDLRAAARMNPFGASLSQPQLLNYGATLVILGRTNEAWVVADSLTGPARDYLVTMTLIAESRWAAAESAAVAAVRNDTTPGAMRINAVTSLAASMAAQGREASADSVLETAVRETRGASRRWYERARLELALARGTVTNRKDMAIADTTFAARMLRALWSAVAGDTANARRMLRNGLPQSAMVGSFPALVVAWIDIHGGRARMALDSIGKLAIAGEHDPLTLDRPDQYLIRWTAAVAYERVGRADSAAAFYRLLSRPSDMPAMHFALRGLTAKAAESRISQLQGRSR